MPARNKTRYFPTQQQIQQISGTYDYLRQQHRDAYRGLGRIGRSTSADKRADVLLGSVANQIIGALQFLAAILSSAQEQVPRVVFEVSPLCNNCNGLPAEIEEDPRPVVPPPDLALLGELDHLLDFANQTGRRSARRFRRRNSPGVIFTGQKKLTGALIKEQRHFLERSATPPSAIEFRINGPDCSRCHQPLKIIDDPEKS